MWREAKVIRLLSIIHSGIILDLVCGFGGSVGEGVRPDFFPLRREIFFLLSTSTRVRSGDLDRTLSFGGSVCLLLEVRVGWTWITPRWLPLFGTWADSLVMVGLQIREMSFRLYYCMYDTAERGLQPKSSPLTLR